MSVVCCLCGSKKDLQVLYYSTVIEKKNETVSLAFHIPLCKECLERIKGVNKVKGFKATIEFENGDVLKISHP